jgi:hypothetical protein
MIAEFAQHWNGSSREWLKAGFVQTDLRQTGLKASSKR